MLQAGNIIALEYSIYLANGTFVSTNQAGEPLQLTLGIGQLPESLEAPLYNLPLGKVKRITLNMTPYCGPRDHHAHIEIPLGRLPELSRHRDAWIALDIREHDAYQARVEKVLDHSAILDLNHPLAGQYALFELKIL